MKIPLALKLQRRLHKEIAFAQDVLIEQLYRIFDKAVLHGGTAIWRCYGSNRFSEDVDVYIEKDKEKLERFFKELEKAGFIVIKKRTKSNSVFSVLRLGEIEVRFEAIFKRVRGILHYYEKIDGSSLAVFTLQPEALLEEKVHAYLKRLKIRDLYDIFFLLSCVKDKKKTAEIIKLLLRNYKEPKDEQELKALLIIGAIPTKKAILDYIKRWEK